MRVVCDAGPLIHLSWIDRLQILHDLFDQILIPSVVKNEVLLPGGTFRGLPSLRVFLESTAIDIRDPDARFMADLPDILHQGEVAAIALMKEIGGDILALDDGRARIEAIRLGIPITGTVGILRRARDRRILPLAMPYLIELQHLGFWISEAVIDQIRSEERHRE